MILIVIILSAFFACIIAANSYLFQNALLWKMASCFVGLWILCMIITVFVCRFDVAINDSVVVDDLDLWAEAGFVS